MQTHDKQADKQALIFEWEFDRCVYGIKRAEGAKVHAATEEDALIKAKYLFRVDFPRSTFILRSKKKQTITGIANAEM